MSKKYVKVVK